ncbi:MAG: hypothetical protein LBH63_01390, partial [Clostridiales Family XIII bacterium]|nr:hypothetical protein [Clostridiales Family XIII bacterium]
MRNSKKSAGSRTKNRKPAFLLAVILALTATAPIGTVAEELAITSENENLIQSESADEQTLQGDAEDVSDETSSSDVETSGDEGAQSIEPDEISQDEESDEKSSEIENVADRETKTPNEGSPQLRNSRMISRFSVGDVTTWDEFVDAMNDSGIDRISLTKKISRGDSARIPNNVDRDLTIDGNGFALDYGNYTGNGIVLARATGKTLTVKNLRVEKSGGVAGVYSHFIAHNLTNQDSAGWTVNIEDVDYEGETRTSGLVSVTDSIVNLKGKINWISTYRQYLTGALSNEGAISARDITFKSGVVAVIRANGSVVRIMGHNNGGRLDTRFTVESGSDVKLHNAVGETSAWDTSALRVNAEGSTNIPTINISGPDTTVDMTSAGAGAWAASCAGTVFIGGNAGTININDEAVVNVISEGMQSAMISQISGGGAYNVDNATLYCESPGDVIANFTSATLWFRLVANQVFNLTNKANVTILNKGLGDGMTPAIRYYGANNWFRASGGSKIHIENRGYGTSPAPNRADGGANQGIEWAGGPNNSGFELRDYGTSCEVIAGKGIALASIAGGLNIKIDIGEGTSFIAKGATALEGEGIFNVSGNLSFICDKPLYYDFQNTRPGGGRVISAGVNSVFQSTDSDLSVWKIGQNVDADPFRAWNRISYRLEGVNLMTLASPDPNDSSFNTGANSYGNQGATIYTRMSGNNASPRINEVFPATNADKYVRGAGVVPEGFNIEGRAIWTNEVTAIIKATSAKDGSSRNATASSINAEDVYGETKNGVLRLDVGAFLQAGDEYQFVDAWRGGSDVPENKRHQADSAHIAKDKIVVADKTPPNPATIGNTVFYENQRVLSGTWTAGPDRQTDGATLDVPVKVRAAVNGTIIPNVSGSIESNGTWTYAIPANFDLRANDRIQIILEDAEGNANPLAQTAFRDAIFPPAPGIVAAAIAYDIEAEDAVIGILSAKEIKTNTEILSLLKARGIDFSKPTGNQETAIEVKDRGGYQGGDAQGEGLHTITLLISESKETSPYTEDFTIRVLPNDIVVDGENYAIAYNLAERMNTATANSISDRDLLRRHEVTVYDKKDNFSIVPNGAELVPGSRDFPVPDASNPLIDGDFEARVIAEPAVKATVPVKIGNGNSPVLTVSTPIAIPLGNGGKPFDYDQGVSVSDD